MVRIPRIPQVPPAPSSRTEQLGRWEAFRGTECTDGGVEIEIFVK